MRRLVLSPMAHALFLGAVAILLYLPALGVRHVVSDDEARYMVIARDLLTGGSGFSRAWKGQAYLSNLYLWVVAAAGLASGVTEFSARLPSALAGIGGVLVMYLLGRRLFGARAGLLAALLLASSAGYFWQSRTVGPDLPTPSQPEVAAGGVERHGACPGSGPSLCSE